MPDPFNDTIPPSQVQRSSVEEGEEAEEASNVQNEAKTAESERMIAVDGVEMPARRKDALLSSREASSEIYRNAVND